MRVLITGAGGLLGLNLALEAAPTHTVFAADKIRLQSAVVTFVEADLLEPGAVERLLEQTQPDWVIHCAALANLEACEANPELAAELNSELPRKLAQHVARGGARLVYISTDAIFDGQRGDYREEDTPNPLNVYARTKLDGERAVLDADPNAIVARVNFYGWSLSGRRSLGEFFFNHLQAGKAVPGFRDVFFCPLLANHLAVLLLKMLDKGLSGVYHVVSRDSLSKYEFGVALAQQFGFDAGLVAPSSLAAAGLSAPRAPLMTLSTAKLTRDLGGPAPDVKTGLEAFYRLYQQGYPQRLQEQNI